MHFIIEFNIVCLLNNNQDQQISLLLEIYSEDEFNKLNTILLKDYLNKKDLNTKELEDTLTAHLKFKVKILCDSKKKSGKVNILFNDNQELEKICNILKKSF